MPTWSPTFTLFTFSPTATAIPAPSCPPTRFFLTSNGQSPDVSFERWQCTFPGMKVGVTNSAIFDINEDFVLTDFGNRNPFELKFTVAGSKNNSHLFFRDIHYEA